MENIPRELPKDITSFTLPKPSKRIMRWNLLLVRDQGRIVVIRRLKLWAFLFLLILAVPAISAVSFLYLFQHSTERNVSMQNELDEVRQKYITLRDEKDILMARLVVTENNTKSVSNIEGELNDETGGATGKSTIYEDAAYAEAVDDSYDDDDNGINDDYVYKPGDSPVTAAKLRVVFDKSGMISVYFELINTTPGPDSVSGYAFVILKNKNVSMDKWPVLPDTALKGGKPVSIKKGHSFSIERFKSVSFKRIFKTDPKLFDEATVIVYNKRQELLYEKTFPITVKLKK